MLAVPSLSDDEVDRMVAACLGGARVSGQLAEFVRVHSDGNPFLVEELLAGVVASGELRLVDGYWTSTGALTPTVPASLGESIRQRLTGLDPTARRVVGAAALLGRRFEWELLPGIAEVDGREVVDGLRRAVDIQLVEVEGNGFRFRHALTREAVLADLLPPDRAQLARRAWPALERAHPGLPGGFCELAAELAEAAGDPEAAADRLVESAGRACRDGALSTAEATARRARVLAPDGGPAAAAADEVLVAILVAAGKTEQALAIGRDLAARFDAARVRPERRTDLLVQLAHAALTAGDTGTAAGYTAAARAVVDELPDGMSAALTARIDAVAAHLALERGRSDEASALAHAAVAAAAAADQPEVECEASQVLGRLGRQLGLDEAAAWFERAAEVAARHRLAGWHLRARHELALIAWGRGDPSQLQGTRDLAAGYGALTTVAVMDLSLADIALSSFDRAGCLTAAGNCARASRRYGLATARLAHLWLAGAHALAGDDEAMQAAVGQALAPAPDDPRILGDLYGRVLPTRSFVADDLGALREQLDAMMPHVAAAPAGTSVFPGRLWWATLHTIEDDDHGAGPRAHYRAAVEALGMAVFVAAADVRRRGGPRASGRRRGRDGPDGLGAGAPAADAADGGNGALPAAAGGPGGRPGRVGRPGGVAARERGVLRRRRLPPAGPPLPDDAGCPRRAGAAPRPGDVAGTGGAAWPRRHQPGGGRAHAGRRGALDQGDRRAALPVHQDGGTAPEQPGRPDRAPRPGGTARARPRARAGSGKRPNWVRPGR